MVNKKTTGAQVVTKFLEDKRIYDVFGYPGGMVTYLMQEMERSEKIHMHLSYHEQGAAFCACGYAQVTNAASCVFATSGPGATNLITGICNAWFDSIPVIFITGQVSTRESKGKLSIRQRGFQETDIVYMVKKVVKYAVHVKSIDKLQFELEKAYQYALEGRRGPVLIDIPIDIMKKGIEMRTSSFTKLTDKCLYSIRNDIAEFLSNELEKARRPCLLLGNGIHCLNSNCIKELIDVLSIPVVTSMPAVDVMDSVNPLNFGFIGAYGSRVANAIVYKCDLLITIGTRLDYRQTGVKIKEFAPAAKLIRFDIDKNEFANQIKYDEEDIHMDVKAVYRQCLYVKHDKRKHNKWISTCTTIRKIIGSFDMQEVDSLVQHISKMISKNTVVTTDVGQNQVWIAQDFCIQGQRILFSAGHGAMGYSLPASIGAALATKKKVICFCGDGGMQMNLQELQMLKNEDICIKIIVLNNHSLGMIRHFQEMYFNDKYPLTCKAGGYTVPDFVAIATAYGLKAMKYTDNKQDSQLYDFLSDEESCIIEVILNDITYVSPKSVFGQPLIHQEPLLPENLAKEVEEL